MLALIAAAFVAALDTELDTIKSFLLLEACLTSGLPAV